MLPVAILRHLNDDKYNEYKVKGCVEMIFEKYTYNRTFYRHCIVEPIIYIDLINNIGIFVDIM